MTNGPQAPGSANGEVSAANNADSTANRAHAVAKNSSLVLVIAFAAVYVVWGSTYLGIRVAVESFPPFLMAGIRFLLVWVLIYPAYRLLGGPRPTREQWKTATVSGVLLFLANGTLSWAELRVPTGVAALLVATVSLWLVLLDWLRPNGTRPLPRVVAGVIVGFGGVVLLVGPARLGGSGRIDPVGTIALLLLSLMWACGSLYAKHGSLPSSALAGIAMQGLGGGLACLLAGTLFGEWRDFHVAAVSLRSLLAIAYLVVFGSGIGFTAYLYILKNSTAARVSTYAFVNPAVAIFLGWIFLGEPVTARVVCAAAVILTSVILVISAPHRGEKASRAAVPAPSEA